MSYYVWVGPRDIDCIHDFLFSDKICYFSDQNVKEKREANIYGNTFNNYVQNEMLTILTKQPNAKFVFYNPRIAYHLEPSLRQHVVCLNNCNLLDILNDKIYTRYWLSQYVPTLPSMTIAASNLSFQEIEQCLCYSEKYIVQKNKSSGGFGTYILSKDNEMLTKLCQSSHDLFIISPYIHQGFSVNVNAVIGQHETIIFSPSVQITEVNKERILYHGADYIAGNFIEEADLYKLQKYTNIILSHIKRMGYLGIIGLDFIITPEEIYFLEVNPRYQASSFLINIALRENNLPSLSEMNLLAFYETAFNITGIDSIKVNYSFYKYLYTKDTLHLFHVWKKATLGKYIRQIVPDGWNPQMLIEEDAYCYSIIFTTNISSINPDYRCDIYSNITGEEKFLKEKLDNELGLKIALVNQGCILESKSLEYLNTNGIIKKAVFSAIDFRLSNGIPINAPINLKFSEFSPFTINYDGALSLYYYEQKISEIVIEMQPEWSNKQTKNGIPYTRIAYLSTDRLRIKHESVCTFKQNGNGCYFCNVPEHTLNFCKHDFEEVLDTLLPTPSFRHILIGGGSGNPDTEAKQIISVTNMIRTRNQNIPIYLMSIPPQHTKVLNLYKEAGITEVAFNIEIWDRQLAKKIMPGKGCIPLEHYLNILEESTKLWGKNGNVRTALIVGLNQHEHLLEATKYLCNLGIQPMFSIFRPMKDTRLESLVPPSNQALWSIYHEVATICKKYNLEPGPSCKECRNNMLAI